MTSVQHHRRLALAGLFAAALVATVPMSAALADTVEAPPDCEAAPGEECLPASPSPSPSPDPTTPPPEPTDPPTEPPTDPGPDPEPTSDADPTEPPTDPGPGDPPSDPRPEPRPDATAGSGDGPGRPAPVPPGGSLIPVPVADAASGPLVFGVDTAPGAAGVAVTSAEPGGLPLPFVHPQAGVEPDAVPGGAPEQARLSAVSSELPARAVSGAALAVSCVLALLLALTPWLRDRIGGQRWARDAGDTAYTEDPTDPADTADTADTAR